MLANPSALEIDSTLATAAPSTRALLLSESWFLRGQNDIDVPIATSLDRFLRAAHYAYDALFTGNDCEGGEGQRCSDLFTAYNRSVREIGRLTNNGTQLPSQTETAYLIDRTGDGDHLNLDQWEVFLADSSSPTEHHTFGAPGAACQTISANTSTKSTTVRRCTPATLTVSFDSRAHEGQSRAHLAAYDTFGHKKIILHDKELNVPVDLAFTWNILLAPSPTQTITANCLADVEPQLPTVFLAIPPLTPDSHWPTLASMLSTEAHLQDHYNFCAISAPTAEGEALTAQTFRDSLDALSPAIPEKPAIVLISQGAGSDASVRQLKDSLKPTRGAADSPRLLLAGSLSLPSPSLPQQAVALPSDLTKQELSALGDMKRLLNRLADSEDGILGGATRSSFSKDRGVTLSPVM
jgi:hypothetical protein